MVTWSPQIATQYHTFNFHMSRNSEAYVSKPQRRVEEKEIVDASIKTQDSQLSTQQLSPETVNQHDTTRE